MAPVRAAIALGSNLDDPESHVKRAFADLAALPQTSVLARSSLHRTKPVGYADQREEMLVSDESGPKKKRRRRRGKRKPEAGAAPRSDEAADE